MKCLRCGFANDTDSKFCEECGNQLEHVTSRNKSARVGQKSQAHTMSRQISDVEDVIFQPKHRPVAWGNVLGVIALVIIGGFFFLVWLGSDDPSSGNSTDTTMNESEDSTGFPISYLNISTPDIKYIGEEAYFIGTLHNKFTEAVKKVYVRVDFYRDKAMTQHFDTRTLMIDGTIASGAFSFQVPLNIYISGESWWNSEILYAEGY